MVTNVKSITNPVKKTDIFHHQKDENLSSYRFPFKPGVPDPCDKSSMERNEKLVRSEIEKYCPSGRKKKISSGYKGFRIDQITFFVTLNRIEGFRYSPQRTERIKRGINVNLDNISPYVMGSSLITPHSDLPRVLGFSLDRGVEIRVTKEELARINEEGGDCFKWHTSRRRKHERHLIIPFSHILEVIFVKRD